MKRYKAYTIEKGLIETDDYSDFRGLNWHNEDGPAYIRYYENGNIECEIYFITDKKHRLDGPATINYYNNGIVEYEEYYVNNKKHRLDGPAYIEYNMNGSIERESYYINGIFYTKKNYYNELLKLKINSL